MPSWYIEIAGPCGSWMSQKFTNEPRVITVDGEVRLVRSGSTGARVRPSTKRQIPEYLEHLTTDQLKEIMSPDGEIGKSQ